ncbi:protein phosphatase 2C domain-containing protein [Micromonospora sp. WMMD1102]|uniref:PP2C family protein-serine/threonine phosphatase n=1 Tax=Micromonospora sp. WMMD1102 TaxID=3016105 RepID=UPI0024158B17|nr:protein phosphatase 2C domain-containing protein [Micromonospora sp. WMMD1102]MDG4786221.1 protein phosphatase 2C domain-containing protein [Micromonospora sp. WMMD1102]
MHRSPVTGPDRMPAEGDVSRSYQVGAHRLSVAGGSRVGQRYSANFDVLHVDPVLPFLAVADGMGDGRGSTAAGGTTMETMVAGVRAAAPQIGPDQLRAAMAQAQSRVRAAGAELGELTGCTFTGLVVVPPADGPDDTGRVPASGDGPTEAGYPGGSGATDQVLRVRRTAPVARTAPGTAAAGSAPGTAPAGSAPGTAAAGSGSTTELAGWIVQIGDSRAYRLRDGLLELLTVDHTAAWLGAVYGWYPADSPAAAAARYQLTRYVGHPAMPEPDLLNVSLRPGDVYCLCTDGVAEQLDYQRLSGRLGAAGNLGETVRGVLADTLVAGGRDNATIAVLRVEP